MFTTLVKLNRVIGYTSDCASKSYVKVLLIKLRIFLMLLASFYSSKKFSYMALSPFLAERNSLKVFENLLRSTLLSWIKKEAMNVLSISSYKILVFYKALTNDLISTFKVLASSVVSSFFIYSNFKS